MSLLKETIVFFLFYYNIGSLNFFAEIWQLKSASTKNKKWDVAKKRGNFSRKGEENLCYDKFIIVNTGVKNLTLTNLHRWDEQFDKSIQSLCDKPNQKKTKFDREKIEKRIKKQSFNLIRCSRSWSIVMEINIKIKNPQSIICRSCKWHSLNASTQPCQN